MEERPPSVDRVARDLARTGLPHPMLVDAARAALASGDPGSAPARADEMARRLLRPVVNATGVLLHTNLGRAPVGVLRPAGYTNLELDLVSGRRGNRSAHAAALLARACGAEAALVVNNGAAAVLLVLAALGAGSDVVVSRGELVEIGGGFRIPEVLRSSGARLVEVGTTNRTRLGDYEAALGGDTALLLKVHTSNYRITGFTESVPVAELSGLGPPVVADLGSGLLDAACPWLPAGPPPWLAGEPAVCQTLAAGADVVTFSGDKLLGGPQAGIIAGRAELVGRCERLPLARAVRPGGLVLDALQEVALAYLRRDAGETVPLWRLATVPVAALQARAAALDVGEVVDCEAVMGGGTLPGVTIPSAGVAIAGDVTAALRACDPPIVARVADGRTVVDLRTVLPEQDALVAAALAKISS
ncbi:MAG: L-seryl-tRNA(Sec) selenium transferase [Acidimicrobiaceae bacterium]|nr:L-seryl-tRNA(Sec) selenium transferase [Acidimicrobiaceae bacterium]